MRFFLALAATLAIGAKALASPLPEYPFVFTTGSAETAVPPDIAHLKFSVTVQLADGNAALQLVRETSDRVLKVLATAGVGAKELDASEIDKSPQRHWDQSFEKSVPDGFEVTRRFVVTVRNLAKYPEMGKALLELPNTTNFDVAFNRTDRLKIEAELFGRAAQDARTRAERMATAFGRKLGQVHAIAQVPFEAMPYWLGFSGGEMDSRPFAITTLSGSEPDRLLVPATISISESVNVVFELE